MKKTLLTLSFFLITLLTITAQTVWLDELDLSAATQGWGQPRKNKSVDGNTFKIAGETFQRGFGTHAVSSITILTEGKATSFSAGVGVDDEIKGNNPAVEFHLIGDGNKLWSSGLMRLGDKVRYCNVKLDGIKKLELLVADGGNGDYYDHANWVDAKFETTGVTTFKTYNPVATEPYILTPKPSDKPRINSAKVFGVRPGSPFQYLVAATGIRPMTFSAKGLPKGLKLNPKTGLITGIMSKPGTYMVTLGAKNAKGNATKQLRIECGDKIALTPPMGWNSWNCFANAVSADKVKRAAEAMVKSGLINHGWTYINVDDFWENHRDSKDQTLRGDLRDKDGYIIPNVRFGNMKSLADYVHDLGLKIGLYSSPGPWTCGGCAGSYGFERQDAESYAKWGFDYLKYDWCSYGNVINGLKDNDPYKVSSLSYNGGSDLATAMKPFKLMGDYLREQPRDIVYSLCQYGMSDVWKWGDNVGGNCWRTTNDITDTWISVKNIALAQDKSAPWSKPGNWNDPDMLVVGHVGWGNPHPSKLKPDEQYLHISLWSLFAAPLLIGCDMEKLDDFTLNLLTNDEVIEVNQDPLGKQATCLQTIGELRIYVKELEDGSHAVGFCNFGQDILEINYSEFEKLGLKGRFIVRDLWRQKDISGLNTNSGSLKLKVPVHGVLLYKFTPDTRKESVSVKLENGNLDIYPVSDNAVRIQFYESQKSVLPELVFTENSSIPDYEVSENKKSVRVSLKNITVEVNRKNGNLTYFDGSGKVILSEKPGTRKFVPGTVMGEKCFMAEQSFNSPEDESIFGLGQFQDGHFNLKGISRRLTQVNSQIAIPFIYSNKGYGLLWHQYGLTDYNPLDNFITLVKQEKPSENEKFAEVTTTAGTQRVSQNQSFYKGKFTVDSDGEYSVFMDLGAMGNKHYVVIDGVAVLNQENMWLPPTASAFVKLKAGEHEVQLVCKSDNKPTLSWKLRENATTFRSPNAKALDYVVFAGTADEVISSYRSLSGNAPMFPKWAYGFWQCRERYTSGSHLVETVKEFRRRNLPLDVIVQDWQYWGNRGWGVPQFDERNYPNPAGFIKELHDLNAHFNISIWSNPDKNSEIGKEYVAKNRFVPSTKWLDYFNPETRNEYWTTLKENMFDNGVDSWWMDAVEPENDALTGTKTFLGAGDLYRLTYPLMVSKAVYEGQRQTSDKKRVCILTRSAFSGQQRYGVINWSGDIGGDWDTYRRQIVAGLNFTITGMPYWTTDIGGFFRPGRSQYSDEKFHELLTRWYQWGTFNPIFRMHGYQSETEPWKYGQKVEDNMRVMLNLRSQLMPYIYSEAWQITSHGSTMMRPLVMDFNNDSQALNQPYEYMFGKSILVAPITEPGALKRDVYLPASVDWYDFWTGNKINGGQTILADAPLDKIPLFVKAGSIIPFGEIMQYADQKPANMLEIRIYEGSDGSFDLFEDEGDNYNYEEGKFANINFLWNNAGKELTIGKVNGAFESMLKNRVFKVVLFAKGGSQINKTIEYSGEKVIVKML